MVAAASCKGAAIDTLQGGSFDKEECPSQNVSTLPIIYSLMTRTWTHVKTVFRLKKAGYENLRSQLF